jgi:AraC family transcriptional regulator of adaptative response/methylated-DNA-[protein]-cysteine methyltransferase
METMTTQPNRARMYRALVERDASFEGVFFAGVKTTGIFCRPTCSAKKPKAENVEFFANAIEALHGGFRACLRCRPMDSVVRPPPLVQRLRAAVERAPTGRFSDKELEAMSIDPSTARRAFRRYYGMTFHAYHRARRMGLALRDVHAGKRVIEAQQARGFESSSGFREAFAKVFGKPPRDAKSSVCLVASRFDTPLGTMLAIASDAGLCLLEFVDRRGLEREILDVRSKLRAVVVPGSNAHIEAARAAVGRYFAGEDLAFDVPLAVVGSPFQRRVWDLLRTIPIGETRSYAWMATKLGIPNAPRAVGRANGSNKIAIVIPCHRVIRADGNLCGYAGGIWRKQWLLDHERRQVS